MAQVTDDKIVLDSSSFKALASESRVLMLKELAKKRCTASELSKTLGISVQAASEHLENLRVAGLVERVDEGRKWIYFALTEKGKAVVQPEGGKRLWIMLTVFALIAASAGFMIFTQPTSFGHGYGASKTPLFNTANQPGDLFGVAGNKALGSSQNNQQSGGVNAESASGGNQNAMNAVSLPASTANATNSTASAGNRSKQKP